ncbi:uncharacterized protein LOC124267296 [Haliotis rubra]|uniref:uncharacterized protein LOC124267296 n=1 Tax=Haliotis rubra TaxID=36100 RepID=UPI001EE50192|nr:uncharacterized protein LOC124267296 [Haliotis rubra]
MRFLDVGIDFLLIQTLTEIVLSNNTIGRTYTLFPAKQTWNEVQDFCVTSGSSMLKIGSEEEMEEFKQIMSTWENNSLLTDYLWMGLYHSNLYDGSNVVYQWQQDCTNLSTYTNWRLSKPSDQDIDHCVAVTLEGKYRTRPCNQLYHTVCQENGPCKFEKNNGGVFLYSELHSKSASDMSICEQECLSRVGTVSECIAFVYKANRCDVYVLNTTFLIVLCPSPEQLRDKTCYTGEINSNDIVVTSNKNRQPEDRCYQTTNYTTTVTTTPTPTPTPSTAPSTEASPVFNCTANSGIQWVDPGKLNVTYLNECLLLNKKDLSCHVRSLTSAEDNRPSAIALGAVWAFLLFAAIFCIILMDNDALFQDRKPARRCLVEIHRIVD